MDIGNGEDDADVRADQRADTPRTAAGRKLLNYLAFDGVGYERHRQEILAIEAEAAAEPAAAEPTLVEQILALKNPYSEGLTHAEEWKGWIEARDSILAIVERAAQPPRGSLTATEPPDLTHKAWHEGYEEGLRDGSPRGVTPALDADELRKTLNVWLQHRDTDIEGMRREFPGDPHIRYLEGYETAINDVLRRLGSPEDNE